MNYLELKKHLRDVRIETKHLLVEKYRLIDIQRDMDKRWKKSKLLGTEIQKITKLISVLFVEEEFWIDLLI